MKALVFSLMILVSCGKDPANNPASNYSVKPVETPIEIVQPIEMADIRCGLYKECSEKCTAEYIACFDLYGGQNVPSNTATPEQRAGFERCQNEGNACYNKTIQIPKTEHDEIMKVMTGG